MGSKTNVFTQSINSQIFKADNHKNLILGQKQLLQQTQANSMKPIGGKVSEKTSWVDNMNSWNSLTHLRLELNISTRNQIFYINRIPWSWNRGYRHLDRVNGTIRDRDISKFRYFDNGGRFTNEGVSNENEKGKVLRSQRKSINITQNMLSYFFRDLWPDKNTHQTEGLETSKFYHKDTKLL